jgi:primosomal protein N' (replication factor Y)
MSPDEPVIQLAARHDYLGFASLELAKRRAAGAPPYVVMARVILRSLSEPLLQTEARRIAALLREATGAQRTKVRILGPAPALMTRLRNYYRYNLQLTAPSYEPIQELWKGIAPRLKVHGDVEMTIDVDPLDLR